MSGLARIPILRDIFGNTDHTSDSSDIVLLVTPHIVRSHEITADDLKPIYIGTGQNFGQTTTPPLISPNAPMPAGVTTPAAGAAAAPATTPSQQTAPPLAPAPTATPRAPGVAPVQAAPAPAAQPAPNTPPGQISVVVPATQFQSGAATPYTVPIVATNLPPVGTLTLRVSYNPTVLRAQTAAQGTFMNQGGATTTFVPQIDANAGVVTLTLSRSNAASLASGGGLIGSIQFLAMSPGSSQVVVSGIAVGADGQPAAVQFGAATVVVTIAGGGQSIANATAGSLIERLQFHRAGRRDGGHDDPRVGRAAPGARLDEAPEGNRTARRLAPDAQRDRRVQGRRHRRTRLAA